MGKSITTSNSVLDLILRAQAWANMADNAAVSPFTNVYVGLHTGALAAGDAQNVNEATFGAYARLAIARTTGGWAAPSGGATSNAALAQFAECTSGSNLITHVSIGTGSSGATPVLWFGALAASRTISSGIQAQFAIAALEVQES